MNITGKISKTEWILLLLTMIFLALVGSLYLRAMTVAEGTDYTIITRQQTTEPVTPEPEPLVDINTADETLLQTLNGIGPALAQRIVAYREEHGPFASVEDLLQVSGIGESTLEKFKDRVTVLAENAPGADIKEANE